MADVKEGDDAKRTDFIGFPVVGDETPPAENFDNFPRFEPTPLEKATAFGQAATGSLVEGVSVAAGTVLGAAVGTLGGPFAPLTVPGGAAGGMEAGRRFGGAARSLLSRTPSPTGGANLAVESAADLPPELRPFGFAGEVVGQGSLIAAAPLAAARGGFALPPSKVGSFINRIIDTAKRSPGSFAATELSALGGGALGAGVAERQFPGDTTVRVGGEIVGGLLNPGRIILSASKGTADVIKQAFETMSEAGRESRAGKVLRDIVVDAGEDPEVLAELLNNSGLPGTNPPRPTGAQATGSAALGALEAKLRQQSVEFGAESAKRADATLSFMKNAIQVLRSTGDPQALNAAADLRKRYFRTLLAGRLQSAEKAANDAAARITSDTPRVRMEISRKAQEAAVAALKEVRDVEHSLWQAVDRSTPADAENVIAQFDRIKDELLPEEVIPAPVEGFVRRVRGGQTDELSQEAQKLIADVFGDAPSVGPPGAQLTNSGELLRFRSRALELAREAHADNRLHDARIFGQMAEAALDDLTAIGTLGGGELTEARTFSRELHDAFTRTFAGQATTTARTGANRIPPELFLRNAFAQGREAGALRMREIEDATRFLAKRGIDTPLSQQNLDIVLDSQERLLRLTAAEAINPSTGRASVTRLGKFLRDNESLLDRFPEVRAEVQASINAENGLFEAQRLQTGATRSIEQGAAFAKLAGFENPVDAVRSALSGRNPVKELLGFVKVAKRGGIEAEEGLKAAVWDHVFRQAEQGGFGFDKMDAALLQPVRPGQPSLADIMQRAGIVSKNDIDQAKSLLEQAGNVNRALQQGVEFEEVLDAPDALLDLVLRVGGARIGAQGAVGSASGSSLVAAGAGSRFLRNMFARVPDVRVRAVLIEAALNPRFGAMLLRKAQTEADRVTLGRQVHAYLLQAGLTGEEEDAPEEGVGG